MIDVAELIKDIPLRGNYYAPDAYVQGEIEFGLLENRRGDRLLALPEPLLEALYAGLEEEIGQGASSVLFSCGRWWGKSFYRRFAEEMSDYYSIPLAEMEMIQFWQCLKQCWKTHGWGLLDFDLSYYQQGFLLISIKHSTLAAAAPPSKRPMGFLEAGILSTFFSQLAGRDLHCVQTASESLGNERNYFVIGLAERLNPVSIWLEEGHDHATMMELLCN